MNKQSKKRLKTPLGTGLVVLSSFFYASYGIWTKLMGNFFDGYTASTIRSIIVVSILVAIAVFGKSFQPINFKKNGIYIVGMTIASMFTWGPLYFAILKAGVGTALAINYASIVIGMLLFGWIFAAEQISKDKILSALLGMVGLILIFLPSNSGIGWLASFAALVSGLSAAANGVFAKKIHYNATQSTIFLWIASVVANAFMAQILGRSYPSFNWQIEWFYLVIFAITSVIASWSLVRGVKLIDAGLAGIIGLLEIVFGIIFGVALFNERPTLVGMLGAAIIIASSAIPYIKELSLSNLLSVSRNKKG